MALPLGELSPQVTERVRTLPGRADFSSFRPKFHVLGRKLQTFKQSAQKDGAKFGEHGFDRSREEKLEKPQNKFKRTSAAKLKFAQTNKKAAIYFLIWEPYLKNINTIMKKVLT